MELFNIPEYVRFQNSRLKIPERILSASKNVRARQEDHRLILGENLLGPVIELFALCERARDHLLTDQAVDLRLPCSSR